MKLTAADAITQPGAYRLAADAYHADPCPKPSLSSGIVRTLLDRSPLHAWHAHPRLNPEHKPITPSRVMQLGSVAHRLLTGRGGDVCVIDADAYRSKEAKNARDAAIAEGRLPILVKPFERAERVVEAARQQLGSLPEWESEVVVASDSLGLWSRCMIDLWSEDGLTLYDYKLTEGSASPSSWGQQAARMGYDVQDAFYQRVVGEAFPELQGRTSFRFVVQEASPPYALSVCEISEADRAVAGRKVAEAVSTWESCLLSNHWPGYPSGVHRIALPEWHTRQWLEHEMGDDAA